MFPKILIPWAWIGRRVRSFFIYLGDPPSSIPRAGGATLVPNLLVDFGARSGHPPMPFPHRHKALSVRAPAASLGPALLLVNELFEKSTTLKGDLAMFYRFGA